MDAFQPRVRVVPLRCAPKTYPCPHCGKRGRRRGTHTRPVRDIAFQEILILEITVGEYRASVAPAARPSGLGSMVSNPVPNTAIGSARR